MRLSKFLRSSAFVLGLVLGLSSSAQAASYFYRVPLWNKGISTVGGGTGGLPGTGGGTTNPGSGDGGSVQPGDGTTTPGDGTDPTGPGSSTGGQDDTPAVAGSCLALQGAYSFYSPTNYYQNGFISRDIFSNGNNYMQLVYQNRCKQALIVDGDSMGFTAGEGLGWVNLGVYPPSGYSGGQSGGLVGLLRDGYVQEGSSDVLVVTASINTYSQSTYREPSNNAGADMSWLYRLNATLPTSVDDQATWQTQFVSARMSPMVVRRLKLNAANAPMMQEFTIPEKSASGVTVEVVNVSDDVSFAVGGVSSSNSLIGISSNNLGGKSFCTGATLGAGQSCKYFEQAVLSNAGKPDVAFNTTITVSTSAGDYSYDRSYVVLQPRIRGYSGDTVQVLGGRGKYMDEETDVTYFELTSITSPTGVTSTCPMGTATEVCSVVLTKPTVQANVSSVVRYYGRPYNRVDGVFTGVAGSVVYLGGDNITWAYSNGSYWLVVNDGGTVNP